MGNKDCSIGTPEVVRGKKGSTPRCCPRPSDIIRSGMTFDIARPNLVVDPNHSTAIEVFFPANPNDGDEFNLTDCFLRLTPATPIIINGNGNLICRTEAQIQPTPTFPWLGAYPVPPTGIPTFFLREIEFVWCAAVGVWCCSCQSITIPCPCPTPG